MLENIYEQNCCWTFTCINQNKWSPSISMERCSNACLCVYYLQTTSLRARCDTKSVFERSSSVTAAHLKEFSCSSIG